MATIIRCVRYCEMLQQSGESTRILHKNVLERLGIWSQFSTRQCTRLFWTEHGGSILSFVTITLNFTGRWWQKVFGKQVSPERPVKSAARCPPYNSTKPYTEIIYGKFTPCPFLSANGNTQCTRNKRFLTKSEGCRDGGLEWVYHWSTM